MGEKSLFPVAWQKSIFQDNALLLAEPDTSGKPYKTKEPGKG